MKLISLSGRLYDIEEKDLSIYEETCKKSYKNLKILEGYQTDSGKIRVVIYPLTDYMYRKNWWGYIYGDSMILHLITTNDKNIRDSLKVVTKEFGPFKRIQSLEPVKIGNNTVEFFKITFDKGLIEKYDLTRHVITSNVKSKHVFVLSTHSGMKIPDAIKNIDDFYVIQKDFIVHIIIGTDNLEVLIYNEEPFGYRCVLWLEESYSFENGKTTIEGYYVGEIYDIVGILDQYCKDYQIEIDGNKAKVVFNDKVSSLKSFSMNEYINRVKLLETEFIN